MTSKEFRKILEDKGFKLNTCRSRGDGKIAAYSYRFYLVELHKVHGFVWNPRYPDSVVCYGPGEKSDCEYKCVLEIRHLEPVEFPRKK